MVKHKALTRARPGATRHARARARTGKRTCAAQPAQRAHAYTLSKANEEVVTHRDDRPCGHVCGAGGEKRYFRRHRLRDKGHLAGVDRDHRRAVDRAVATQDAVLLWRAWCARTVWVDGSADK